MRWMTIATACLALAACKPPTGKPQATNVPPEGTTEPKPQPDATATANQNPAPDEAAMLADIAAENVRSGEQQVIWQGDEPAPEGAVRRGNGSVSIERDEFTGRVHVLLRDGEVASMGASFGVLIVGTPRGRQATFSLHTISESGWRFLRCHDLAFTADGRPLPVARTEHEGSVLRGSSVGETISGDVPLAHIRSLAGADDARGRVCNDEFTLDRGLRQQLAAFVTAVESGSVAAAPPQSTEAQP